MKEQFSIMNRMFVIFGIILILPVAISLQLLRVNYWAGQDLRNLWSNQAIDAIAIPAQRGNIYDNDGSLLVTNSVAYQVAIDPYIPELTDEKMKEVCSVLAENSSYSMAYCLGKIYTSPEGSRYVVLDENISITAYESLHNLDLRAVILEEEYERVYNFGSLAAHMLGFVNYNLIGVMGLEKEYNKVLKGTDGEQQVRRGRNGEIFAYLGAPSKQPEQGYSLYTTINSHIQAILEEELKTGVIESESNWGSAIVMDPRTGAVLAMANYPAFNPNKPAAGPEENRRNHMISSVIEPGSTFKLVTAVAALEQGKVGLHEKVKTPDSGELLIHGQWMRDHDPLGTLSFPEVIQKSSNIATSKIAMRLSKNTFYQYVRNMGFGTPTGIDLPDEQNGRLQKPYKWSLVTLPWMSVGYEVLVTPLQIAQAYAAFANEGLMMEPYVVEKIVDGNGNTVLRHEPIEVRRIAAKETIKKLYPAFERVVTDSGTAEFAQIEGLAIAGKTGTAQKYIDGRYRHEYRSSFVGFFPVEDPQYLCLVLMDGPQVYPFYGGWVAAPVFQQTAKRIAGLDNNIEKQIIDNGNENRTWANVPRLRGLTYKKAVALLSNQEIKFKTVGSGQWIIDQKPKGGAELNKGSSITLVRSNSMIEQDTTNIAKNYAIIPDLVGLSIRQAVHLINKQGFEVKIVGSGTVNGQYPEPGGEFKKGRTIIVRGNANSLKTAAE